MEYSARRENRGMNRNRSAAPASAGTPLADVARVFLRLGLSAFGGPAAHVALMEREFVVRRQWIRREQFLDLLGVASLIPGPTSTELAMHIGRARAGWPGLVVAGLAFLLPAALLLGILAYFYVRTGNLPVTRGLLAAVQPVVVVMVAQAILPLARAALGSAWLALLAVAAGAVALLGVPEIYVLLGAGLVALTLGGIAARRAASAGLFCAIAGAASVLAAAAAQASAPTAAPAIVDVFAYFMRVGALLFGSGYVLLPVLQGDLVDRLGWLTDRQLLDAIAAGQATPGPLFTTATFVGFLLGGPAMAVVATVGMFLPAFVFSALSAAVLERLRASRGARRFLDGVNAAAIALIAVVVIELSRVAFTGWVTIAIGIAAAVAIFVARISATRVLLAAALAGAIAGYVAGT